MTDDWTFQQKQDEERLQQEILAALQASQKRILSRDEAMLLAWSAGCATEFYRNTHNTL